MPSDDLTGKKVTLDLTKLPTVPPDNATFVATANALQVIDDTSYQIAAEMIQRSIQWDSEVDTFFEKGRAAAHESWKWFTGNIATFKAKRNVRPILEPRMKAWDLKKARIKAEAEAAQRRADEQRRLEAEAEARRIQKEADDRAAALRQQGEMRAAREVVAEATQQAEQVVAVADSLEDLGTILPSETVPGGPGKSMPWTAEMVEYENEPDRAIMETIRAIASGKIPLRYAMPVRGEKGTYSQERLVEIVPAVLKEIGKRMAKEDIGVPGAIGKREVQLRFSSKTPGPATAPQESNEW